MPGYQDKYGSSATNSTKTSGLIKFKSDLKLKLAHISLRLFGNTLGFKINSAYFIQHQWSRIKSRGATNSISEQAHNYAAEVKTRGFTKIGPLPVDELSDKVKRYFDSASLSKGTANMERHLARDLAPQLYQLLSGKIEEVLRAYYGSYVQPYWINPMRYGASPERTPDSSFGYHLDDNPRELLKIFIYLNDTYKSNGAFRTFDYEVSKSLFKKGFISSTPELRVSSQKLIEKQLESEKLHVLEGPKGTILIFDNNVVHKGTIPEQGYRDVICVEVYPSARRWQEEDLRKGLAAPIQHDYPHNPFINDILSTT